MTSRADAARLDEQDPLAGFRDRFVIDDEDLVYLDGNSLGRLPRATRGRLLRAVDEEWGRGLVTSWSSWVDLATDVGDRLGAAVLGAAPGQTLVSDSTSVNLYKLAVSALDARPGRTAVVIDVGEFPTDRFVLEGICAARGLEMRTGDGLDGSVGLVVCSHVSYATGERLDVRATSDAVHDVGALVLWDLSHSAGAVPIELDAAGADLAVGCTYKYLNAGPGAPAFLYVRSALQTQLRQPIWGWFGQRDQFAMGPVYDPYSDLRRFQVGTPPVLGMHAVDEGVALVAEAGIDALAAKGAALTAFAIELADAWLAPLGFDVVTPRDAQRRGAHVALRHPDAWPICQALVERARVVPDFRAPDIVRLGLAPLFTRFVDVWEGVDRVRRLVEFGDHKRYPSALGRIT
ncbi:MAG: kynureninase [Actinomycetota bacterium]